MKKLMLAISLVLLFALPALAAERCDNCRMKVEDGSKQAVTLTMKDGSLKLECGIYCASMEVKRSGDEVASVGTVDYNTGEKINAADAVWVSGSDVSAMMSDVSRIAFKDKAAAESFVKEHGGNVVTYEQALSDSVKEWRR